MMVDVLLLVALWLGRLFLLYFGLCFVVPIVSVYQEYKIWAPCIVPSLSVWGMLKVYLFNVVWTVACLFGALLLLPKFFLTGSAEREAHAIEHFVAFLCLRLFVGPVVVKNAEKLPSDEPGSPAPIYICNHASQIDLGAVYYINRRFKWIAKSSVRFLPGVGQIMALSKHVFIDRKTGKNKSSVTNLYDKSNASVQAGCPMFFFPQGTRRMTERLPFKDGALNVALQNKSSLVPLSLEIPLDAWNRAYPLLKSTSPIVLTVHDSINVKGDQDKEQLRQKCFDIIYSVLPMIGGESKKHE
jgi:1-acyl-sn-glycerol-3-phosphate acyltransferase